VSGLRVGDAHGLFQKRRHGLEQHLSKAVVINSRFIYDVCQGGPDIRNQKMNRTCELIEIIDNYSLIMGMAAISE